MQQLETDLNFISSLADQPAMTTTALKQEFDKAGNTIKDFINNILEAEITSDIASCLASAKSYTDSSVGAISLTAGNISYDNTSSGMTANNVQSAINELKTGLSSTNTTAGKKTVYSDFAFSSHSANISLSAGAMITGTIAISKSGYYPLGIIGDADTQEDILIRRRQITERSNGSGKISYKVMNDDRGAPVSGTITFDVLWVKIR